MITYKKISHDDYDNLLDISKDIWGGTDYLPHIFHQWVDDKGFFLGAYNEYDKLVGCAKLSYLLDGTGWLEGLRVHKDYRNLGIGKELASKILGIAKEKLKDSEINKIAFATHLTNVESININTKLGFKKEWESIIITKDEHYIPKFKIEDFRIEYFNLTYEDYLKLDYCKKLNGLVPLSFKFEKVTPELIEKMNKSNQFISINGYKGMFSIKGDISFEPFETKVEAIDAFYEYFSVLAKENNLPQPMTSICKEDLSLKEVLINNGFNTWCDWQPDYFYFVLSDIHPIN
ncbi:Acetyltransferase (GNAT) family protein [Caloramator mitchellensis]|uniref:Acetyltransferase (GNAT) family protein n=1 Tax=Caloramator mitchellensis TaxID=908809 RepID=A0A0R3K1P4_CALMK|nr:GNAT family N-acetyltransferase [Caloramator mitchellensis]KRQ86885.1 Acetyltransferase (GNAT) family protein [Caloramator mitchellensis]